MTLASGLALKASCCNYTCDTFAEGNSALQALEGQPQNYDLAVIDLMLPGRSGFELTIPGQSKSA